MEWKILRTGNYDVERQHLNKILKDIRATVTVGGSTSWGSISGTLSSQTDLASTLAAKLDDSQATAAGLSFLGAADATAQTALLNNFTSSLKGLVPASGGGTTTFLRADGNFATPPSGSGTVTSVSGVATNGFTWSIATSTTTPDITLSLQTASGSQSGQLSSTDWTTFNGKASLASPTFTGTPAAPTAAVNTNTTQVATTAFVLAQKTATTPLVAGTATIGSETRFAAGNHVHPTDTSRAPTASPTFTGTPITTTAAVDTNTTQIASTAFVLSQASGSNPIMDGTVAIGTSTRFARADHVHASDTTKANLASPTFTGTPISTTASVNTSTTQIATTAFVMNQLAPRVQTVTSSATITPTSTNDLVIATAQAANLTIANPTGSFVEGQGFVVRVKPIGAFTVGFGTGYRAMGAALPTALVSGKNLYIPVVYNATDTKWDVLSASQEA